MTVKEATRPLPPIAEWGVAMRDYGLGQFMFSTYVVSYLYTCDVFLQGLLKGGYGELG